MYKGQQVVAVIPARDEAPSIASVVNDIRTLSNSDQTPIFDRILVCDNGSLDETANIAAKHGAEVVYQAQPGYGIACLTALEHIDKADILVFIDADASVKIEESLSLLNAIETGADLVIGIRIRELREKHAMNFAQQCGNRIASLLIRIIWCESVSDLGPFRAIKLNALKMLDMKDKRYGWTVEMQVKAVLNGLKVSEVPVHYYRRIGRSKISGTLRGVLGAGYGICATILKLAFDADARNNQSCENTQRRRSIF